MWGRQNWKKISLGKNGRNLNSPPFKISAYAKKNLNCNCKHVLRVFISNMVRFFRVVSSPKYKGSPGFKSYPEEPANVIKVFADFLNLSKKII